MREFCNLSGGEITQDDREAILCHLGDQAYVSYRPRSEHVEFAKLPKTAMHLGGKLHLERTEINLGELNDFRETEDGSVQLQTKDAILAWFIPDDRKSGNTLGCLGLVHVKPDRTVIVRQECGVMNLGGHKVEQVWGDARWSSA